MIKKVIYIILCVIVVFNATACASDEGTDPSANIFQDVPEESVDFAETEPINEELMYVRYFSDDSYNPTCYNSQTMPSNEEWYENGKELDTEFKKQVNELLVDECNYINEKWEKDWHSKPVEVYSLNVIDSVSTENTKYGAFYDLGHGTIFIDDTLIGELEGQLRYIIAHELIHYLYEINSEEVGYRFAIQSPDGNYYIGDKLDEAFTDSIARKYMISRYSNIDRNIFKCRYKYSRLNVDLMAMAVPEIYSYYLDHDIYGMQSAIDDYVCKRVYCEDSAFVKWASMNDELFYAESQDIIDDRMSAICTLDTFIIPKSKSDAFVNRAREDEIDLSEFVQYMH